MITIITLLIIGAVISVLINYEGIDSLYDYILILLSAILGALIGGFIGFLVAIFIPSETKEVVTTRNLIALKDTSNTQGSFFLGTGIIDEKMKYTFYYEAENGFKLKQIDYKIATIKYINSNPKIDRITTVKTDAFINKFSLYLGGGFDQYIIYLPENTISNNFSLDLE